MHIPEEPKEITGHQALAARKYAGAKLRKFGITTDAHIQEFDPCRASWAELNKLQNALTAAARGLLERSAEAQEAECRELEAGYQGLMGLFDLIEAEKDDREDRKRGDPRRPLGNGEARGDAGEFVPMETPEPGYALKPEERYAERIQASADPEMRGLTLGRYLRSMVLGPRGEIERRALAEGTDSAGGFTVPTLLAAQLIDLLRRNTVAIAAGAQSVPLGSDNHGFARLASDPVPAWRAEAGTVAESDPTFELVSFVPRSLAVLVKASRELLEDSVNINTALPNILAAAMGQELDRVVFHGSGTSPEPKGLDTLTGVQTLAHNAALADYAPLVNARRLLLNANVQQITAYVMHPEAEADFGGLVDSTGQPLRYPPVLDRPSPMTWHTTTAIPTDGGVGTNETTIYVGDFRQLAVAIRSEIRVEVLRERYADTLEYGFLAHLRADVAAFQPTAFVRITGVQV